MSITKDRAARQTKEIVQIISNLTSIAQPVHTAQGEVRQINTQNPEEVILIGQALAPSFTDVVFDATGRNCVLRAKGHRGLWFPRSISEAVGGDTVEARNVTLMIARDRNGNEVVLPPEVEVKGQMVPSERVGAQPVLFDRVVRNRKTDEIVSAVRTMVW